MEPPLPCLALLLGLALFPFCALCLYAPFTACAFTFVLLCAPGIIAPGQPCPHFIYCITVTFWPHFPFPQHFLVWIMPYHLACIITQPPYITLPPPPLPHPCPSVLLPILFLTLPKHRDLPDLPYHCLAFLCLPLPCPHLTFPFLPLPCPFCHAHYANYDSLTTGSAFACQLYLAFRDLLPRMPHLPAWPCTDMPMYSHSVPYLACLGTGWKVWEGRKDMIGPLFLALPCPCPPCLPCVPLPAYLCPFPCLVLIVLLPACSSQLACLWWSSLPALDLCHLPHLYALTLA